MLEKKNLKFSNTTNKVCTVLLKIIFTTDLVLKQRPLFLIQNIDILHS